MTLRELADSLIRETQDMRWQQARDVLQAALEEQYRLGFVDGEAQVRERLRGTMYEELRALDAAEDVEGACV